MPSVRLDRLRKQFGDVIAINDISVEFRDGELTSVLGPSGCGKTTTLNVIAGFIAPDGGTVHFGEQLIADSASGIEEFDQVRVAATAFVQVAEVALHLFQLPGAVRISLECGQERGVRGNFGNKCVHVRVHLVHLRSAGFPGRIEELGWILCNAQKCDIVTKVTERGGASVARPASWRCRKLK